MTLFFVELAHPLVWFVVKMTCPGLEKSPTLVGQILEMLIFLELTAFVFVR